MVSLFWQLEVAFSGPVKWGCALASILLNLVLVVVFILKRSTKNCCSLADVYAYLIAFCGISIAILEQVSVRVCVCVCAWT